MSSVMVETVGWWTVKGSNHNPARDSLSPKVYIPSHGAAAAAGDCCCCFVDEVQEQKSDHEAEFYLAASDTESGRHARKHRASSTSSSAVMAAATTTAAVATAQRQQQQSEPTTMPSVEMAKQTCLPRSAPNRRRPFRLELEDSRGATTISPAELRHLIKKTVATGATAVSPLRVHIIQHTSLPSPFPYKGRKKYGQTGALTQASVITVRQSSGLPPNVAAPPVRQPSGLPRTDIPRKPSIPKMGNQHSHHAPQHILTTTVSSPIEEEDSACESTAQIFQNRHKAPPKRGSINVLRRKIISKTEAPSSTFTTTIIEVPRAATAPNLDAIEDENDADWVDEHSKENRIRHAKTLSAPSPALAEQPGSPATITEESAARPLSAATTVTEGSNKNADNTSTSSIRLRISAMSPTIPTPSPMPEDSPHQYGLKDFADTPSPPPDQNKAKRRSTGLDIFNEAKDLQSAASFLNGLSNARRRAESREGRRKGTAASTAEARLTSASMSNLSYANHSSNLQTATANRSLPHLPLDEPPSPTSTTSRPLTPKLDDLSRSLGHTHKSSGFAYAKPLGVLQLKCYHSHNRLLRSGNKYYQVECAVCHQDQPEDFYWSCTWCALRMCEGCNDSFRKRGTKALKEKIRSAEFGAQSHL